MNKEIKLIKDNVGYGQSPTCTPTASNRPSNFDYNHDTPSSLKVDGVFYFNNTPIEVNEILSCCYKKRVPS